MHEPAQRAQARLCAGSVCALRDRSVPTLSGAVTHRLVDEVEPASYDLAPATIAHVSAPPRAPR